MAKLNNERGFAQVLALTYRQTSSLADRNPSRGALPFPPRHSVENALVVVDKENSTPVFRLRDDNVTQDQASVQVAFKENDLGARKNKQNFPVTSSFLTKNPLLITLAEAFLLSVLCACAVEITVPYPNKRRRWLDWRHFGASPSLISRNVILLILIVHPTN